MGLSVSLAKLRNASLPELIHAARKERGGAFDEIERRFRATAHANAYSLLRDLHAAQDVTQEAFLDAYLGLEKLRDPAAFAGWFRRIVFKHADRIRRGPRPFSMPLDGAREVADARPRADLVAARAQEALTIRRAVDRLPEHERVVVALFYFDQQSHAEIGKLLGHPVSTIKKRLHDARRHLRVPLESPVRRTRRAARSATRGGIVA